MRPNLQILCGSSKHWMNNLELICLDLAKDSSLEELYIFKYCNIRIIGIRCNFFMGLY